MRILKNITVMVLEETNKIMKYKKKVKFTQNTKNSANNIWKKQSQLN